MNKAKGLLKKCLLPNKNYLGFFKKQLKCILMLQLFFCVSSNKAQITNYVNNGSFENIYNCNWPYGVDKAKYWRSVDSTSNGGNHYSTCNTSNIVPFDGIRYQWPRTGAAYILCGYYCPPPTCTSINNRGYQRNRLKATLQAGKTYCVKFYINIGNVSSMGIDGFGAYFGDNTLDTITKGAVPLTYLIPQILNPLNNFITDTLGWVAITGTFVANGTEKHCLIGNFKSDVATNTILINPPSLPSVFTDIGLDDVSCIPLDLPAYAAPSKDVWAIPGTTVYLGRPQDVGIDEACEWFKLPNTTSVIANAAGLTLTVAITTNTYMVKQTICGIVKYDTVVVHASGLGIVSSSAVENNVKIYPSPANDILNIEFVTLSGVEASTTNYSIINSLGQIIREEVLRPAQQPNSILAFKIKVSDLSNGVYILKLSSKLFDSAQSDNLLRASKRFVIAR